MLKRDDINSSIRELNEKLRKLGFDTDDIDEFDLKTDIAACCLQKALGLEVDGIVGNRTMETIDSLIKKNKIVVGGNSYSDYIDFNDIIIHQVDYLSQRDNENHPKSTCNVTALAMLIKYYNPDFDFSPYEQLEDFLWAEINSKEGLEYYKNKFSWASKKNINPNTVHGMLDWVANKYDIKLEMDEIFKEDLSGFLDNGPLIVSTRLTSSGHIVLLTGYVDFTTEYGNHTFLIVNDPYGDYRTSYSNPNGENRVYCDVLSLLKPGPELVLVHYVS